MTDTLEFGVAGLILPLEFADVLQELLEPARSRFVYDAAESRSEDRGDHAASDGHALPVCIRWCISVFLAKLCGEKTRAF